MTQPPFPTRGVVDLSTLRKPSPSPTSGAPAAPAPGQGESYVFDVSEADFQTRVMDQSATVPVVIDLWAEWCGPCKQLSPVLERLAAADQGRWVLAKVDVDANQRLAAAFGVQSIPAVFAVLAGQLVPMFTGALPEQAVRQYLDELLRLAAEQGVVGRAVGDTEPADDASADEPPLPADIAAAFDAMERGDLDTAAQSFSTVLADRPRDEMARAGLAQVMILRRVSGVDPHAALAEAAASPADVALQQRAADVELLSGQVDQAFRRLLALITRTGGEDRDTVRQHLLELFDLVGLDDPRVVAARRRLTSALF